MRTIKVIIAIVIVLLVVTGCKKDEESTDVEYTFPLTIGNTWTYLRSYTAYDVQAGEMVTLFDTCFVWVDAQVTSPTNEQCYRIKYRYSDYDEGVFSYYYLVNRSEGLFELGSEGIGATPPIKKYGQYYTGNPFPYAQGTAYQKSVEWLSVPRLTIPRICNVGVSWNYVGGIDDYYLPHTSIIEAKEVINAPIGSRTCIKKKVTVTLNNKLTCDYYDYYSADGNVKFYSEGTSEIIGQYGEYIGEFPWSDKLELITCDLN